MSEPSSSTNTSLVACQRGAILVPALIYVFVALGRRLDTEA